MKFVNHFKLLNLQDIVANPHWLSMYLCGLNLECLQPLVFQQLQMRQPGIDPSKMPSHSCACCSDLEPPFEEAMSIMQLRWTLLKYFSPLEHLSEDTSRWNIFWSTAEEMYGSEAQFGDIQHERAQSIVVKALEAEFDLAAWPCPEVLTSISDMIILRYSHMPPALIGFAMIPQHRTSNSADAQQAASASRPATARPARASGQSDDSSRRTGSKAGRGAASDIPDGKVDSQGQRCLELLLEPGPPEIVGVLPRPEPDYDADACPLLLQPAPASEAAAPAKQYARQLSMMDFKVIERLAQVHMHSPLLANASLDMASSMRLPSGMSLQQLSELEMEQLDALSIQMAIAEQKSFPKAQARKAFASATATDAFSSSSSRGYLPPQRSPAAAAEAADGLKARLLLLSSNADRPDHAASPASSKEGSNHDFASQIRLSTTSAALHAAAATRSSSASISWQHVLEALLHHLSLDHILKAASVEVVPHDSEAPIHLGYLFASPCAGLHAFAERQFAIAAVMSSLRGRPLQFTCSKEEADDIVMFARKATGQAGLFSNADDAAKAATFLEARHYEAAGTCGWIGIKPLDAPEQGCITHDRISQLCDKFRAEARQCIRGLLLEFREQKFQQQLHGRLRTHKHTRKQARPGSWNTTAEAARQAEAAAAAAAAELLLEEEKEQQAKLQKADKAAAKHAKALQKKAQAKKVEEEAAQRAEAAAAAAAAAAEDLLLQQEKEHQAQLQKADKVAAKRAKARQKKAALRTIPSRDEGSNAEQESPGNCPGINVI